MRKLLSTLAISGLIACGVQSYAAAAPVSGFEDQYSALIVACTLPVKELSICEDAINAYTGAIAGAVDIETANASLTSTRSEVFAANEADETYQSEVDDLFELLLPDSGDVGTGPGVDGPIGTGTSGSLGTTNGGDSNDDDPSVNPDPTPTTPS
jgi:hypothetical protein